jgi:hypothetical protein
MVNMNGPSYRMKETKEWLKKQSDAKDFLTEENGGDAN